MAINEIASLTQVRRYLRMPNPANPSGDDATLQMLMSAAQRAIEKEVGHIVKKTIRAERHNGGKREIYLRELPVLYVQNVEEGWGYYDWELDDQQVNSLPALSIWSYSLDDDEEGIITRRSAGNVNILFVHGRNNIRVDYVVGRKEIPGNAALAFCELVSIWYRQSQMRMGGNAARALEGMPYNALNQDFTRSTGDTSINLGVPEAILEMLKPDRARPVFG